MTKPMTSLMLLALAVLLGACAGGAKPQRPAAASAPAVRGAGVAAPPVMAAAGLEGVIGSSANDLIRRFGPPRIDLAEGDVRKLQFAGPTCVLDIYLYPPAAGTEGTASYVAARQRQGGALIDPKVCIREAESR
jgi:hypothetical protein